MQIVSKKRPSPEDIARGKRMKAAREAANLTQSQAAEALTKMGHKNQYGEPIAGSLIGNWEQGTRFPSDIQKLIDLAKIYGSYASWMLNFPEAPEDKRQGKIMELYNKTDERGRNEIWRTAESQPVIDYAGANDNTEESKAG